MCATDLMHFLHVVARTHGPFFTTFLCCYCCVLYTTQTFRILDGKDGKVDGVLSIAKRDGGGPQTIGRVEISEKAKAALK